MVPPSERRRPSNPCDRDLSRRRKRTRGQTEIEVEGAAKPKTFERTRATALDIIAAVDVHRFDTVLCETVLEFATDWELFHWRLSGMKVLAPAQERSGCVNWRPRGAARWRWTSTASRARGAAPW